MITKEKVLLAWSNLKEAGASGSRMTETLLLTEWAINQHQDGITLVSLYSEMRRIFSYLRSVTTTNGSETEVKAAVEGLLTANRIRGEGVFLYPHEQQPQQ
ncbi:hypothetical protein HLH36_18720 [Gluconacetobacter aggeris]|uniref:Uncharacterized protein n=1 Tax=Gluconacetobacter aggeris TaxID=1286186 RepID=A0A7W4IWH0_9PROT|nr:hypothetical protein [Gluconacetobacter aggeris]MBB2170350.1 hypothetical protein [Gluconacetobacter aggeris]